MAATWRWVFFDPTDNSSWTFEINPNEGGSPANKKTVNKQASLRGGPILTEGMDEPQEIQFSGTVLTKSMYDAMVEWFNKRHAIQLTDDLERVMQIYIVEFTPTRKLSHNFPWKHTYSARAVVLSVVEPT